MDEYEEYFADDNVNSVFIRDTININFEEKTIQSFVYLFNHSTEGLNEILVGIL